MNEDKIRDLIPHAEECNFRHRIAEDRQVHFFDREPRDNVIRWYLIGRSPEAVAREILEGVCSRRRSGSSLKLKKPLGCSRYGTSSAAHYHQAIRQPAPL